MKLTINTCKREQNTTKQVLWELCKHDIKCASINYGRQKCKTQCKKIQNLEIQHSLLTAELLISPNNAQIHRKYSYLKAISI